MSLTETLGLISVGLNVLVAVVGFTWGLAKIRSTLKDDMEAHKDEIEARVETLRTEYVQTFNSIRQKISDVELFGRDHFVKIKVFEGVMQMINNTMQTALIKIDDRMVRIEDKLDRLHPARDFDGRVHG